jgi:putative transposase
MARHARVVIPEATHHLVARGVNGCRIFRHGYDKVRYLKQFAKLASEYEIEIHAYCLMSNHLHFLLTPKTADALARFMQRMHTWWAIYYNRLTGRTGHLFGSRFYSSPVDEQHYWAAMRYIELNPKRAGFRQKSSLWQFSSLKAHLEGKPDPLIPLNTDAIKRRRWSGENWREFLEEAAWEREGRLLKHPLKLSSHFQLKLRPKAQR